MQKIIGIDFGTSTTYMNVKRYNGDKPVEDKFSYMPVMFSYGESSGFVMSIVRENAGRTFDFGERAAEPLDGSRIYSEFKMRLESLDENERAEATAAVSTAACRGFGGVDSGVPLTAEQPGYLMLIDMGAGLCQVGAGLSGQGGGGKWGLCRLRAGSGDPHRRPQRRAFCQENRGRHHGGVLYLVDSGYKWRQLPHDFPPYSTVHS